MTSTFRTELSDTDSPPGWRIIPGGLPSFLVRDDVLCWTRREAGLVGFGEVARFTATGPERFLEADIWWRHLVLEADITDAVECPGTGPVAFGSFAFSKVSAHESRLIVPEIVVGVRDGRAWLTQLTFDDGELTEAGALAALERWLERRSVRWTVRPALRRCRRCRAGCRRSGPDPAESGAAVVLPTPATLETGSLSEEDWMAAVAAGVAEIRTGALEKLVLARDIVATVPDGRERRGGPAAAGRPVPRMLDVRRGRAGGCHPGDADPGGGPHGPGARAGRNPGPPRRRGRGRARRWSIAERVLAGSEKQRHEHEIAIQSLTTQLAPFSEAMNAHSEPFILELPNVWHLASDVKAELTEVEGHVPTCLALINALHPTAAVCGTPTTVAGALIRKLEHLDRGPYAGPGRLAGRGRQRRMGHRPARRRHRVARHRPAICRLRHSGGLRSPRPNWRKPGPSSGRCWSRWASAASRIATAVGSACSCGGSASPGSQTRRPSQALKCGCGLVIQ